MYGTWPRSGEIDLLVSREFLFLLNYSSFCTEPFLFPISEFNHSINLGGNLDLNIGGKQIGVEQFGSTLHFGPRPDQNGWPSAHYERNTAAGQGFNKDFHKYELIWTPEKLRFSVDGSEIGVVEVGEGFWKRFTFQGENPWTTGTKAAPFDQEVFERINFNIDPFIF